MFYRLRWALSYLQLNTACRDVYRTPPLRLQAAPVEIVSMLSHRDLLLYLGAIKSFYARFERGTITVIDDGTLTSRDQALLQEHIPGIHLHAITNVSTGKCPRGGAWERLLYIAEACSRSYVIQLDSDTVTLGDVPEVIRCVEENHSFVIGTEPGQTIGSFEDARIAANQRRGSHIQLCSERLLPQLNMSFPHLYVRGCAGFSGFARGSVSRAMIEQFSESMEGLLGRRWQEWGTEQVTSNVMVAQSARAYVLPFPKYSGFEGVLHENAVFQHFYGTHRFKKGVYADVMKRVHQG